MLITSVNNEQVKKWKKLHTTKEIKKTSSYLVEGYHLVEEALKYPQLVSAVIGTVEQLDTLQSIPANIIVYTITDNVVKAISQTTHSQGIFAICQIQEQQINDNHQTILLLDTIQDPGNMGTIIRTADACGIDAIIIGQGCCNIYQDKVLRAAQGSHFHIPCIMQSLNQAIEYIQQRQIPIYGTALHNAISVTDIEAQQQFALILGNEGQGINPDYLSLTTKNIKIPMRGRAESLNVAVAAGILMYQLVKESV